MVKSKELALKIADALNRKGATDITILEVDHLTSITDFFVIASGRNTQAFAASPRTSRKSSTRRGFPRAGARGSAASRAGWCSTTRT